MGKAVLYIGHGTRSKSGMIETRAFIQRVMRRVHLPIQEYGFLEWTKPSIEEGFRRCIDRGASEINIVPLFLLAAGHIKQDIPQILSSLQAQYPSVNMRVSDPFGVQEKILGAMTELVGDTAGKLTPADRVLIVGRGSSDPGIHADFADIANGMKERLTIDVSICYMAAAKPDLEDGLKEVRKGANGTIVVVPHLLFPGLLLAKINRKVQELGMEGCKIMHTGPLSRHRVIEKLVIDRAVSMY